MIKQCYHVNNCLPAGLYDLFGNWKESSIYWFIITRLRVIDCVYNKPFKGVITHVKRVSIQVVVVVQELCIHSETSDQRKNSWISTYLPSWQTTKVHHSRTDRPADQIIVSCLNHTLSLLWSHLFCGLIKPNLQYSCSHLGLFLFLLLDK